MSSSEKDVRRVTHALLSLQQRREELAEMGESMKAADQMYTELCEEIREKGRRNERYATTLLRCDKFYQAMNGQDGN